MYCSTLSKEVLSIFIAVQVMQAFLYKRFPASFLSLIRAFSLFIRSPCCLCVCDSLWSPYEIVAPFHSTTNMLITATAHSPVLPHIEAKTDSAFVLLIPHHSVGLRPLTCWDSGFESHRGHGCVVRCECCVLSGRGLCDELITRPEESYRQWCVVVCDLETSRMGRPWPAVGRSATKKMYMIRWTRSRHQIEVTLYIVQHPNPFSLDVQPDDGLLEAETCSC